MCRRGSLLAEPIGMRHLLLLALIGCNVAADPGLVDKVRDARDRMHRRFTASQRMQHAIALGQLERAREEARLIDALDEPDILPEWKTHIDRIRAAAREVVAAKDTVAAARSSAALGNQCASCHEASKIRITFATPITPPPGAKLASQMESHDHAIALMWEGLIGPDDDRWLTGARRLGASRLPIVAEDGRLGIADDVSRLRLLARRALAPQPRSQRAELYGELLGTCARCHFTIRD